MPIVYPVINKPKILKTEIKSEKITKVLTPPPITIDV